MAGHPKVSTSDDFHTWCKKPCKYADFAEQMFLYCCRLTFIELIENFLKVSNAFEVNIKGEREKNDFTDQLQKKSCLSQHVFQIVIIFKVDLYKKNGAKSKRLKVSFFLLKTFSMS